MRRIRWWRAKLISWRGTKSQRATRLRVQPCISPVWDTAIAMVSLEEAGLDPAHPSLIAAERWVVANQILGPGDWQVKNPNAAPGGWAFEFKNEYYPDVDDTAFVLMALGRVADPDSERLRRSMRRGLSWLVSMQNEDGGWGAFDHENNLQFLNHIPFADHNAMLDPSTADVTARAVECLGQMGWSANDPILQRARAFHPSRTDSGRFVVRPLGRELHLRQQRSAARARDAWDCRQGRIARLRRNGCARCRIPTAVSASRFFPITIPSLKGKGKSTASQTAWAIIGLLAVAGPDDPAVQRAMAWLLAHQNENGTWDEAEFTGTGFPCVFYLKYHIYRNAFPLYALARYDNMRKGRRKFAGVQIPAEELQSYNGLRT